MKTIDIQKMKTYILLIVLIMSVKFSFGQADSIQVETEIVDSHGVYYEHKYRYLDVMLSDETKLFKFALQPFKPNENFNFGVLSLQLAYENKLSYSISITSEIYSNLVWTEESNLYSTGLAVGMRWYPTKNAQIRKGLSGDNCNGYYLGLKASNLLRSQALKRKTPVPTYDRHVNFLLMPEASLGLQQRITNRFYVDAYTFVNYDVIDKSVGFGLQVLLGISLNVED